MTRLQILENTTFEMVEGIASKLHNDGLKVADYTIQKANAILENTCLPSKLKVINKEFEGVIKYYMAEYEKGN